MIGNYERRRSPNKANLARTHNALMSAASFHAQNVGVCCLVEFIRIFPFVHCSTTLPINETTVVNHHNFNMNGLHTATTG